MKPQVSIIIPTWNTCKITLKCIKTIEKYLPSGFAQIIVVDNDSTDNTQQIFSKLSNLTYIRNTSNFGFSKANNIGAKKATADYFFFLNSDIELIDNSLLELIKYAKSRPQLGLIGPKFLNPDLTPQGSVTPPQTPLNAFKEFWLKQKAYSKYIPIGNYPSPVWAISGGAVLISHADFQKVGGWDEKYFFYFEDLELCRQIKKLKKQIIYYPQCQIVHHHGTSGTAVTGSQSQWRRLIPGSIKYHGYFMHYLINFIIWSSQKFSIN
jgi:GT2 family glycosyltransferase